ncbi:MAG: hypothetical protein ACOVQ4_10880 [Flectobacillus sp.]|uniref:hypothetical protein n=1 Tax=Flectobacillus sp. TaxID=50419 RepID=UPI003B9DB30B
MRTNFSIVTLLVFLSIKAYSQNTITSLSRFNFPLDSLVYYNAEDLTSVRFTMSHIPWFAPKNQVFDKTQIHPEAIIRVNEVIFPNKSYLDKMPNVQVYGNTTDTATYYVYLKEKPSQKKPVPLSAAAIQYLDDLPESFVTFKKLTLEELRYTCSVEQPFFDGLGLTSEKTSTSPRYLIDGQLQSIGFKAQQINLAETESIVVYSPENAKRYFSSRFEGGLVVVNTHKAKKSFNLVFKINVVESERISPDSGWKIVSDTVLANMDEFRAYRKAKLEAQSVIYMIDNRLENEHTNRKTIDLDRVVSIETTLGQGSTSFPTPERNENKVDTIKINTRQVFQHSIATMSRVISELKQMRENKKPEVPLYIVDNEEIDMEKLKQFSRNEIELVTVLSSCDGMQKYGKKAEFGAVIFRRKSPKTSRN